MINGKGKFIVIDGTDGSGKATQTDLIIKRLRASGYSVAKADFPQYGQKSAALVEEYLNGKYGAAETVGPYRASIFYAVDRYDASFKIREWLNQGKIVIANRYVASNMGHQGGKVKDPMARQTFFDWLYDLEYDLMEIPRPDQNIILHVDAAVAQGLVDNKDERAYIKGAKRDIHEADLNHLRHAEQVYLEIAASFPNFSLIECSPQNRILTRAQINDLLWQEIKKVLARDNIVKKLAPNFINTQEFSAMAPEPHQQPRLKLIVQRLTPQAKLPTRAYAHDAGLDLYANDYYSLFPRDRALIQTGIKIAIPSGCAGLIWDKGGIAKDGIHAIAGVVDAGYRGEVTVNLINLSEDIYHIAPGQKIAQLLIQPVAYPQIVAKPVDDSTDRNTSRFGSSGLY